ncbi:hypothetical protein AVEN_131934-1 [Araneus ventricosus]|uniref:Histone-lysine N-methyltransferase SETMAR n=1 Tax=Araneus ventricosus TaxID=182803 RepID=A0A4Y2B2Y4_ARAVE|nr:hypothetical protein AVEN_131934-1 [Araneus ventricosus]
MEIFDHPPYSPDLAPSDFHLFLKLKEFLSGKRFGSDGELENAVTTWVNELASEEYDMGILKLMNRYDKCLNVGDWIYQNNLKSIIWNETREFQRLRSRPISEKDFISGT